MSQLPSLSHKARSRRVLRLAALIGICASSAAHAQLATWDFFGESQQATSTADVFSPELASPPQLTRGSGAAASAGSNSFRTVGFQNNGIATTNTDWFQTSLSAAPGKVLSLSTINARFAGTATFAASPGVTHQFSYSFDGINFTLIGEPAVTVGTPATLPEVSLAAVPELQNIPTATTVYLRYYASGQTATGGWGFNSPAAGDYGLQIGGTITDGGPDTSAPQVTALNPANNATNIPVASNLVITFNEPVTALTGNITLNETGGSPVSIPVNSGQVAVSGNVVTIDPTADLAVGKSYQVLIDANTFQDAATNKFAGISSPTTWTFSTIGPDVAGPAVVSVLPANGATNVDPGVNPVINFNENVLVGTGNILIKNAATNVTVATLSVTDDSQVLVFNDQAFLTFPAPLPTDTQFYVEIPAGAFTDALLNPSPAYGGAAVWSFSTPIIPALTLAAPYTQNFAGFAVATPNLPAGWGLTGPVTTFPTDVAQQAFGTGTTGGLREATNLLGFQATGTASTLVATLQLVNQTGAPIDSLTVQYTGRVARVGQDRKPAWLVNVAGQATPALTYSTAAGVDQSISASVTGLAIPPGEVFSITWSTDRGLPNSGASQQIGLTDVSVSVGTATFPPSIAAVSIDFGALTGDAVAFSSEVTADGGSAITVRGFVIAPTLTNPSPEIGGTGVVNLPATAAEVGVFDGSASGLETATQYAVRAYATNAQGTVYSPVSTVFTLAAPPVFDASYNQEFNGFNGTILNGTLPAGWKVVSSGGINGFAGNWGPSTSSGGLLGNVSSPGVLGYQHVGASGVVNASLTLTNGTGFTLEQLYVSYLGRVERATQSRTPEWTVSVNGTEIPQLAYSTDAGTDEQKSHLITGLSIAPGATFTINWSSSADLPEGQSGTRRQIGIANVLVAKEAPVGLTYNTWAIANVGGAGPAEDTDGDGVANCVEYFMGETGSTFTPNPVPNAAGIVTWPRDPNATDVIFAVSKSGNLQQWTEVDANDPDLTVTATSVSFKLPTTPGPGFVRLEVSVPVLD